MTGHFCIITDQNVILHQNTAGNRLSLVFLNFPFFHHFLFVRIMIFEPYNFSIERNQITFWNDIDILPFRCLIWQTISKDTCLFNMHIYLWMYLIFRIGFEFISVTSGNSQIVMVIMTEIHSTFIHLRNHFRDQRTDSNTKMVTIDHYMNEHK